jgi:hypothetical protein
MGYLYRRKYTRDNIHFGDIFSHRVALKEPFEYMAERTLLRPRDIISFTNLSLDVAEGRAEVAAKDVKEAEAGYSKRRYEALLQEWIVAFPWLAAAFKLLRSDRTRFTVSEISGALIDDFVMTVLADDSLRRTEVFELAKRALDSKGSVTFSNLISEVLSVLYRIGAIGLKLNANERYRYAFIDQATVSALDIDLGTKVHIHPMLQRALGIYDDQRSARGVN